MLESVLKCGLVLVVGLERGRRLGRVEKVGRVEEGAWLLGC